MNRIIKNRIFFLGACALLILMISDPVLLNGQNDEAKSTEKQERVQKTVRIQLEYYNMNNEEYTIRASVRTKEGRSYVSVENAPVRFSIMTEDGESEVFLGEVASDVKGISQLTGNISNLPRYGTFTFKAAIEQSADFKKYSKNLDVINATMAVQYVTEDSTNLIKVHCSIADSSGQNIPMSGIDIKVFVERLFGELPISIEFNTTDENGEVSIVFPHDVCGDTDGQLVIVARVEDHDDFGNLVNRKEIPWGIPLVVVDNANERLLWAGQYKAPMPLVILINGVLIAVWGMILYIVLNMVKIFRVGRVSKSTIET